MSKSSFLWLCDQLRNRLLPCENYVKTREPVSVEKQVAITLYFLGSCAEYRVVANAFGVHKSTVWKCVHRVVNTINSVLMDSCVNMPNSVECDDISFQYEKTTHIPNLIGAIDGTHIPILPPADGYRDFVNRKGWPSMILQAVVDHSYRFRNINCKSPGSSHDAAVFQQSVLFKQQEQLIPKKCIDINGVNVPFMIMGDPAYPLLPWLLKGYTKSARLTPEEESFNVYLNAGRVSVEIAFGRLKARWRCLLKRLDIHYSFVPQIVSACCILHNIVESRKEAYVVQWEKAVMEAEVIFPQPRINTSREREHFSGHTIRDTIKNYLASNFPLRKTWYK
ncbi:protein ALP1-like [Photinus pyralis]|nr:protein ALP1-like [Photinus pyralis]